MKGWSVMALTESRCSLPAKDQTLLTRTPRTHGPWIVSATKVGPAAYLPDVRFLPVPVGKTKVGPIPQIMPFVGCLGEKKKLGLTSPRPNSRFPVSVRGGWEMMGVIQRVIRL